MSESASATGAVAELETLRWWLLRWGPRADSGVILADEPTPEGAGVVDVTTLAVALPVMALTRDFAPADMQYRMHRELLWDEATGQWRATAHVNAAGASAGDCAAVTVQATRTVIEALGAALAIGGDTVPTEMRERWSRQRDELVATLG